MYSIVFNTDKCCWEIKLQKLYGLYWATLKGKEFPNIVSAEDYIQQVGLDKVYTNYNTSTMHLIARGEYR